MVVYKIGSERLVPAAWVWRGEGLDAVHTATVAVVDGQSRLSHALGDVEQSFYARSAVKGMQALPQLLVRQAVADTCEVDVASIVVGTDGCSAPSFALPLRNLAIGFKNLATREDEACSAVRAAMLEHPLLVSGERRLDYELSQAFPGRVLVKGGAEGLLLMAFREPALGIAIKVVDGATRALGPIAVETLKQLRLLEDITSFPTLLAHERPRVKNARGLTTGEIRADFRLSRF